MIFTWITFLLLGLLSSIFSQFYNFNDSWAVCTIVIVITSIVAIVECHFVFRKMAYIIVLGYMLRIMLLVWDVNFSHVFQLPGSGGDTELTQTVAIKKLYGGKSVYLEHYTNILVVIYKNFGINRPVAQYLNILLFLSTACVILASLKLIGVDNKEKRIALSILSYAPNYAILCSILLRESIQVFLIALALHQFVLWYNKQNNIFFICSVFFCVLASLFHNGSIAPVAGFAFIKLLYDQRNNRLHLRGKSIIGFAVLIFMVIVYASSGSEVLLNKFFSMNINDITSLEGVGGSGYQVGIHSGNTVIDFVINTPIRFVYYFLSPMPWSWRGVGDIFAFVSSSLFYFVGIVYSIYVLRLTKSYKCNRIIILSCLAALIFSGIIFAWGVSNAGTALRHRDKFIAIFALMIGCCYNEKARCRDDRCGADG